MLQDIYISVSVIHKYVMHLLSRLLNICMGFQDLLA